MFLVLVVLVTTSTRNRIGIFIKIFLYLVTYIKKINCSNYNITNENVISSELAPKRLKFILD